MSMSTDAANRLPATRPASTGRRPGWYIPYLFFPFFGIVIAVNGVMLYFALSTFNGLETEDHFVKGIQYNRDIAGAKAQAERGWQVALDFESPAPGKGKVVLNLHDKFGNLLKDAKVRMKFIRPTVQGYDRTIQPEYAGDGRYVAALDLPLPGIWDVRFVVEHATGDYQDQQRVWVD